MDIHIIAIGKSMPEWVSKGFQEYAKRLSSHPKLHLIELPAAKRDKNTSSKIIKEREEKTVLQYLPPKAYLIALDEHGRELTTTVLAEKLLNWQEVNNQIYFLIGGADGLSKNILARANEKISLSKLTLPHPLVRVVLAEQLYRANSINQNHPYHRS